MDPNANWKNLHLSDGTILRYAAIDITELWTSDTDDDLSPTDTARDFEVIVSRSITLTSGGSGQIDLTSGTHITLSSGAAGTTTITSDNNNGAGSVGVRVSIGNKNSDLQLRHQGTGHIRIEHDGTGEIKLTTTNVNSNIELTAAGELLLVAATNKLKLQGVPIEPTGGTTGDVLTLQASGRIELQTPSGGGGSSFVDNVFRVTDDGDPTKKLAFEVSGVTAATTRTLTVPNADGTILLNALASAHLFVGSAGGVATDVAVTGDVTISNTGVTAIGALKVTNAMLAGSIDLTAKVTGVLPVANGGTGLATITDHGVIVGSGAAAVDALAVGASGSLLLGITGADPAFAAMSGDATITNAGVITIKTSVALAGSPTTTTQAVRDNSTKIATTAYADAAVGIGGWTNYTPTFTQTVNLVPTVNEARFMLIGKTMFVRFDLAATVAGTTNTNVVMGGPTAADSPGGSDPIGLTLGIVGVAHSNGCGINQTWTIRASGVGASPTFTFIRNDIAITAAMGVQPNAQFGVGSFLRGTICYEVA